jgi:hypothetical protein
MLIENRMPMACLRRASKGVPADGGLIQQIRHDGKRNTISVKIKRYRNSQALSLCRH